MELHDPRVCSLRVRAARPDSVLHRRSHGFRRRRGRGWTRGLSRADGRRAREHGGTLLYVRNPVQRVGLRRHPIDRLRLPRLQSHDGRHDGLPAVPRRPAPPDGSRWTLGLRPHSVRTGRSPRRRDWSADGRPLAARAHLVPGDALRIDPSLSRDRLRRHCRVPAVHRSLRRIDPGPGWEREIRRARRPSGGGRPARCGVRRLRRPAFRRRVGRTGAGNGSTVASGRPPMGGVRLPRSSDSGQWCGRTIRGDVVHHPGPSGHRSDDDLHHEGVSGDGLR